MNPSKKRILVIGASGYLGQALYRYFQQNLSEKYQITGTYCSSMSSNNLDKLDITSFEDLEKLLTRSVPDFIVLAAGEKNVQACEADYSRAYALNTQPVESLISIISHHKLRTRLIYFSTDYVFDGKTGQYRDTDTPNPSTNYGKTKVLAEQALLNSDIDFKILRTAAVMGEGGNFFDWLIQKLTSEKSVSMYDNVFFSPTPLTFLAEMIAATLENYDHVSQKILHVVGEKRFNRYQFALLAKSYLKSDISICADQNRETGTLFQHDLSMVPSDIINTWRKRNFEDYLKDEIQHAAVCE
jgi:dTDP-4-dehydrorhamnose reductase